MADEARGTEKGCAGVTVARELSVRNAASLCQSVERRLTSGLDVLTLDLSDVKSVDVVGLAALLQCAEHINATGTRCDLVPSSAVLAAAVRAQVRDDLPGMSTSDSDDIEAMNEVEAPGTAAPMPLARTPRLVLRTPSWDDLPLFERWAIDPLLDQMVGSELLYQCRHLGTYHPDFVSLALADPASLTVLVQPAEPGRQPVGFVRLYNVSLSQGFGFLETAVASVEGMRRSWGIEASRLFLAFAVDALGLTRIEAKVYAYNILSVNSLRRNGFQQEGVLRRARLYDGQRWDILVFSILREEMVAERQHETFPYLGFWSAAA